MKNRIIASLFFIPVVILLLGGVVFLLLPPLADYYLLPKLLDKLPFTTKELTFSYISPWRLQGRLRLENEDGRGVSLARFEASYSPAALLKGEVSSLLIDSALVHIDLSGEDITVAGLPVDASQGEQAKEPALPVLPLKVGKISIINSRAAVKENENSSYDLIIDGEILPTYGEAPDGNRIEAVEMNFSTRGIVAANWHFSTRPIAQGHSVTFELADLALQKTLSFLPDLKEVRTTGRLHLKGNMQTLGLRDISEFNFGVEAVGFSLARDNLALRHAGEGRTLFTAQGDLTKVGFQLMNLQLIAPEECGFAAEGSYAPATGELQGMLSLFPERTKAAIKLNFQGKTGKETTLSYQVKGEPFTLPGDLEIAAYRGLGAIQFGHGVLAGKLEADFPKITDGQHEVTLHHIKVALPFEYPAPASGVIVPGDLVFTEIEVKGQNIARLKAGLTAGPEELVFGAEVTTPLHHDFIVTCSGRTSYLPAFRIDCMLPEIKVSKEAVPEFMTLPAELSFSGKIGGEVRMSYGDGRSSGYARLTVRELDVALAEYAATGISGTLEFPGIPSVRSKPGQLFTVDRLQLGKIEMNEGRVYLRVDDRDTIFIEKATLGWCNGKVETGALTLSRGMEELSTTLYCDRLSYTELLAQFGLGDAEGQGSLNGRLPVIVSREGVEFDDGFLFSTPGNSGIVRFNNTEKLRQGMAGMSQAVYLDYSMDALENFSYNWTKLTFDTEDDELLIALQLDGKPAEPLPYGYKSGQMIKSSRGKGIQHPIRLDVNFRLPMRDLFRYGKNIQSFMENM